MTAPITTRIPLLTASVKRTLKCGAGNTAGVSTLSTQLTAHGTTSLDGSILLRAYARFILDFTGEDEAVFTFSLPSLSLAGSDVGERDTPNGDAAHEQCSRGFVHAIYEDETKISCVNEKVSSKYCKINIHEDQLCDSEFTLIWDRGDDNATSASPFSTYKFLVAVTGSFIRVDFDSILVPGVLTEPIFQTLVEYIAPAISGDVPATPVVPAVLNHPPPQVPPSWEHQSPVGDAAEKPQLLHQAFVRRANEHPDHPAVDFLHDLVNVKHTVYTFGELDRITTALAQHIINTTNLEAQDGSSQRVIPVFLSTSPELYICWLSVLKAGCAFSPLPVEAPQEIISGILDELSATLVLGIGSAPEVVSLHKSGSLSWVDVRSFASSHRNADTSSVTLPEIPPSSLAYVMYTSGSTGKPKGVCIAHSSAACSIASHILAVPHVNPSSPLHPGTPHRWFQFAAPTFDPSVMEIFVTLSTGGTLCACDRAQALTDPEAAITELAASIMMATPSMASVLRPENVPTLRYLWTMGEALGRGVIEKFAFDSEKRSPGDERTLVNAYGPTEGSVNCTLHANVSVNQKGSVIGHALATCSMLVLDPHSREPRPVPMGFPGELTIGGPQVGVGYLDRPEATAAAFVESETYGKLYRTGDMARVVQDRDGSLALDFLGRITTDQVKLSGRRVELGDIEAAVTNPLVIEAAALATSRVGAEEKLGSEQIVVFLVPRTPYDADALWKLCTEGAEKLLQPYMRPRRYFVLEKMPRSASGKLNRKALEEMLGKDGLVALTPPLLPGGVEDGQQSDEQVFSDEKSLRIRDLLGEVTRVQPQDITFSTNLLSLGFDSLRAVRFLQRAREAGLGQLAITDALLCKTVGDLVEKYRQDHDDGSEKSAPEWEASAKEFATRHASSCAESLSVPLEDIEAVLPTTSTQSGMLASFLRSLHPDSANQARTYINHSVYTMAPGHHPDAICEAWTSVLSRYEMTRTLFVPVADEMAPFAQCILTEESPRSQVTWTTTTCDLDTEFDSTVSSLLQDAENSIALDKGCVRVGVVHSTARSAIVLSIMHAVFDGGSLCLLMEDIEREFQNLKPISRPGFALATKRHFSSDREGAVKFWRENLEGTASSPFPNLRSTIMSSGSVEVTMTRSVFSEMTLADLQSKAAKLQTSPLAVLQTAWALILYAYTGCPADVTFGSVISDRFSDELAACSGPTFTTIPIRVPLGVDSVKSTGDVALDLTQLNVAALRHLHIPLSSVLTPDGRLPYDTLFAFQDFPQGTGGEQLLYQEVVFPPMHNDFAVMIEIWPTTKGNLELKVTYRCEMLGDGAATTMMKQLDVAITNILEAPEARFVAGVSAFPESLLSEGTPIEAGHGEEPDELMLLHTPFEKHALETPDKLALLFRTELDNASTEVRMTYRELNEEAEMVASYLEQFLQGEVTKVVPICMAKCPDLYVAILGILKAGAAWCPIDPNFPPARQNHLIERTGSSILVTSSGAGTVDPSAIPEGVSLIDFATKPWKGAGSTNGIVISSISASPSGIAYLIFTSGTTGLPKGVPVPHRAASAAMRSLTACIPSEVTINDSPIRCMQFSQYTFDVFVQDLFYTWRLGGVVVSASHDLMVGAFPELANLTGATHAHLTPAFGASIRRSDIKTLKVITMIGEKLPQVVGDEWGRDMLAYNTYGPAEAAVVSTVRQFGFGSDPSIKDTQVRSSNVGWPLTTVRTFVMRDGRPVMVGGTGELVLAGVQLADGYWRSPENTNKKFVQNETIGEIVYHTGDIVRQLADGSLDFVGREDDLVKINGMRVELSEISACIRDCDEHVSQVEVLFAPIGTSTEKTVVCFVGVNALDQTDAAPCVGEEARGMIDKARNFSREHLPKHMVPQVFVILSKIPRTPSAKVDRKALLKVLEDPEVIATGSERSDAGVENHEEGADHAEWREKHSKILDVFLSVAKFPDTKLGPETGLSELGIDSIGAIRLSSRLKEQGHRISVLDVLKCKYVGDIVDLLQRPTTTNSSGTEEWSAALARFDSAWKPLVEQALGRADLKVAPTTIMQEGLLTETMREPLSYWGTYFFTLSDSLDLERLRQAWAAVASTTEALRAGFIPVALLPDSPFPDQTEVPTFVQVIYENAAVAWEEVDCSGAELDAAAQQQLEKIVSARKVDGFAEPMWKVTILSSGTQRTMLVTAHHAIYDADSIRLLAERLALAYQSREVAVSKTCQLSEAVARINMARNDERTNSFWAKALQGFADGDSSASGLPKRAVREGTPVHREQDLRMKLPLSEFRSLVHALGVSSVNSVFRVAWGAMLAELLESSRVLFAEIRSDRVLDGSLATAIAPLVSSLPAPFVMTGTPMDLVRAQDGLMQESLANRLVRPSVIRELVGRPASEPLYSAVLVFHPRQEGQEQARKHGLWDGPKEVINLAVEHPFALNVFETEDDGVILSFAVDESLMDQPTQEVFLEEIDALVSTILSHPDVSSLSDLTQYFPEALQSISPKNEDTACPVECQPTHWVEHWAESYPDWLGVEIVTNMDDEYDVEIESWTYGRLNSTANQVAHWLNRQGLESTTVGVCLDRTLLSYAITLGIMKSGNTYIPIEENLPMERKAFLLQDGNAAVLFAEPQLIDTASVPSSTRVVDITSPEFLADLAQMPSSNLSSTLPLSSSCYILYTSGSTGKPKGVRVTRSNLSNFTEAQSEYICAQAPASRTLDGTGKYLCLASRAFDVHIGEMFLAWRHGLCATSGSRTMLLDNLPLALKSLRITHASFVPSLLDQTGLTPEDAPELVYLGVGGEKMTPRTQSVWGGSTQVALVNAYGPTEVTVGCCSGRVRPDSDPRNIGRPLGNSLGYVLVPGTEVPVKKGMPGELVFSGSLVAEGYHNRPDAKGFVMMHGEWMYRTGDIVCMAPDGSIIFLGRKDDQVKVRGQRLELGEISEAVRAASKTEGTEVYVATLLLQHPAMSKPQLVTFVASTGAKKKTEVQFLSDKMIELTKTLRPVCERVLPAYMVPDLLIPVSRIPLTETSAKADNKLLKAVFQAIPAAELFGDEASSEFSGDTERELNTAEEEILAIIRAVVPGVAGKDVRPGTSIFQLGIDSLRAISLSFKLKKAGYEATVASVLQSPTVELLAMLPRASRDTKTTDTDAAVAKEDFGELEMHVKDELTLRQPLSEVPTARQSLLKEDVASIWPCMPLQEVLVAHSFGNRADGDRSYINHMMFELVADVNLIKLRMSWGMVVALTPILRTAFLALKDRIIQAELHPSTQTSSLAWQEISLPASELENCLLARRDTISDEILAALEARPALRITLAKSDDTKRRLLMLSIHHGLYDMDSIKLILDDVQKIYAGQLPPWRPSTEPLMQYISSIKQRSAEARCHWQSVFADYRYVRPLTLTKPISIFSAQRTFKTDLATLESRCSDAKLTIAGLIQGLFGICLAQLQRRNDTVFGVVLSGRSVPVEGAETMAVPCIATVPHRVNLRAEGAELAGLVRTSQTQYFQTLEWQHTSLRDIQAWVGAAGPLFGAIFSFVRTETSGSETQKDEVMKFVEDDMTLDYAFAIEAEANTATNEIVLRSKFAGEFGSSADVDVLLEKMEVFAGAVLNSETIKITPFDTAPDDAPGNDSDFDETHWDKLETKIRDAIVAFSNVGKKEVGKNTSFIRLGIDSISAIRFARDLRAKGVRASSADVVRSACLGALVENIRAKKAAKEIAPRDSENGVMPEVQVPADVQIWHADDKIEAVYPLTPLQTGMITSTLALDSKLYSHHHTFELGPEVDIGRLEQAWASLLRHHDILRTSFHAPSAATTIWTAVVHSKPHISWQILAVPDASNALNRLVEETSYPSASSFIHPPAKATILKDPSTVLFVASLHHVVYDGVSVGFLFTDLLSIYNKQDLIPRPAFSSAATAIWKSSRAANAFWCDQIRGYRSFSVPLVTEEQDSLSLNASTLAITRNVADLSSLAIAVNTTLQTACLLAYAKALFTLRGARDVVFGQVVAGRNIALDGADVISGPLFNTVPFRVRMGDSTTSNKESLKQVQALVEQGMVFEHASLAEVQKAWRGDSRSGQALFDSLFVFQRSAREPESEEPNMPWKPFVAKYEEATLAPSEYRLNFEVHQGDKELVVQAFSKMSQERLDGFVKLFNDALLDVLVQPGRLAVAFPDGLVNLPAELIVEEIEDKSESAGDGFDNAALETYLDKIRGVLAGVVKAPSEKIKAQTSVFSLGLDSILAIRVSTECRKAGVPVSAMDIMRGVVVGRICEIAAANKQKAAAKTAKRNKTAEVLVTPEFKQKALARLGLAEDAVEDVLPLLAGQEYHVAAWLKSGRTLYEPSWVFQTKEVVDLDRLRKAWTSLRHRHAILRTNFVGVGSDSAVQVVLPKDVATEEDKTLQVHGVDGKDLETATRHLIREISHSPSDLFTPPVRLNIVNGGQEGGAVVVTVHHAAYDAWSMVRLLGELEALYLGQTLVPDVPSFLQYAKETITSGGQNQEEAKTFWEKSLGHCQPTVLAPKHVQPRRLWSPGHRLKSVKSLRSVKSSMTNWLRASDRGASKPSSSKHAQESRQSMKQSFSLVRDSSTSVAALERVAKQVGVSPQAVLFLAFARLLKEDLGVASPVFGYFQTGRSSTSFDGIERLAGPCLNMLPASLPELDSNAGATKDDLAKLLRTIQASMAARMPHEQSRLRDVLRWTGGTPFNTHLNILWNDALLVSPPSEQEAEKWLHPMPIGVPTDYSSTEAIPGETAVDGLDAGIVRDWNLFVDVGPNRQEDRLEFGARCDAVLMEEEELMEWVLRFDGEVGRVVEGLV